MAVAQAASESARAFPGRRYVLTTTAFIVYLAGRSPFLGQWDSFDYLKETVTHSLSALGFGRPVFVGYNVVLWEVSRWVFHLSPLQFEEVALLAVVTVGTAGAWLFERFSRRLLPGSAARMAALAFMLSPSYAVYAGYVMADVPMLVAALAAAAILWPEQARGRAVRDACAGICFGLSIGLREQAVTLVPAFLWIVWVRRPAWHQRMRSAAVFGVCAAVVSVTPVVALYYHDPGAFARRMSIWLAAIPMGPAHFWRNAQATVLFTLALCPAAWVAFAGAALYRFRKDRIVLERIRPASVAGVVCCLVLPVAALWRDADVQLHPRYTLLALPAAVVVCAYFYHRWLPSGRAALAWAILHVATFGVAQAAIAPFRQMQTQRREYARAVSEIVPGPALMVAGSYSPVFDYYRAVGLRPDWQVVWSGWGWSSRTAENAIRTAWARGQPLYVCDGPTAWLYFEDERLDLHFILRRHRQEPIAPGLVRVYP